jgi:hypothetical protein
MRMSSKSDGYRAHALAAERSASAATDPSVRQKLYDLARTWNALADMVDNGKVVDLPASIEKRES